MSTMKNHLGSFLSRLALCGLAAPLLFASSAHADLISVGFQEPGVNSGLITTEATGSGNLTISGVSYGIFSVNDASAQDFAVLGPPGLLNSQVLDISTAKPETLTIWVTAQGLSFTGVKNFVSSFAVNKLSGSIVSVTESTYFSSTNALYGGTLLNSSTFSGIGTQGPFTTSGVTSGTYSVTEQFVLFDIGGGSGSDKLATDLSGTVPVPVPEPSTLVLFASGLLVLGLALKIRQESRPSA